MTRPLRHFAYRLGDKLGIDVDIIMSWPVGKLYEYMAFYITQDQDWIDRYNEEKLTPEERTARLVQFLQSGAAKGA